MQHESWEFNMRAFLIQSLVDTLPEWAPQSTQNLSWDFWNHMKSQETKWTCLILFGVGQTRQPQFDLTEHLIGTAESEKKEAKHKTSFKERSFLSFIFLVCLCKNKTNDSNDVFFSSLNVSGKRTDKKSTVSFVADLFQNHSCTMAEREEMEDEGWALAHEPQTQTTKT